MSDSGTLDLLLVNPSAAHGIYGELGNDLIAVEPPLWCRLIAGYIRDRGYRVQIVDAEATNATPHDVARIVAVTNPRLVCLAVYGHQPSASTQQMVGASATAHAIKDICKTPIIMVGGHVAALPQRTMKEEPIDFACNGEGPLTIYELLNEDIEPQAIHGLVWRDAFGTIHSNEPAPLIEDLDRNLHGQAWDLLPMDAYRAHNWQCFGDLSKRKPYASIYTSLGCPFKCSFCCINAPFNSNRYRMRSPEAVVSEIAMLHEKYGVSTLKIIDEMFVLKERHYMSICDGLIERGLGEKLNIWAYARIDTVKQHTLAKLRAAGFRWLALGIESGSKHVRDGADKALRHDDIIGTVRAIQAAGINVISNYIFGLPDDSMESMQDTLDLSLLLNTEFANFYCAQAYPGSRLYTQAVQEGWALPDTWAGYSQHNEHCRPLDTERVSAADVLRFRDAAFNQYFSSASYLAMIKAKFGDETVEHVRRMLTYKLKRNLLSGAAA